MSADLRRRISRLEADRVPSSLHQLDERGRASLLAFYAVLGAHYFGGWRPGGKDSLGGLEEAAMPSLLDPTTRDRLLALPSAPMTDTRGRSPTHQKLLSLWLALPVQRLEARQYLMRLLLSPPQEQPS